MKARALCATIVVGAILLAGIVWVRTPPSSRPGFVPPAPKGPEFGAAGQDYDLSLDAAGREAFSAAIRDATRQAVARSSDAVEPDGLANVAAEHLTLLIGADFNGWMEFVHRYVPEARRAVMSSEERRLLETKWNEQAKSLAGSRVSTGGVRAVKIVGDPAGFPEDRIERGTMITSARSTPGSGSVNPAYQAPRGSRVECFEIQIPVEVRSLDGTRVKAMAGLRYAREKPGAQWQPVDMFFYFDSSGFGRTFADPVF